jgi:SAM-dependent methyltransferase
MILSFALLGSTLFAAAASAARLDVGVYEEYEPVLREAAAIWVADTGNQAIVHPFPHSQLMEFPAKGDMDVLIPSCNRSADIWEQKGFVLPASRKPMFCARMAVIVPPANPKGIRGIEDLGQSGIRWGKIEFCAWRGEKLLKGKEGSFVATSVDADDMMDLVARGKVDAVLGWDYTVSGSPLNPVVIRLPVSRYGSELAALIPAFVTPTARSPKEAEALVAFLSGDARAQRVYLSHGLMLDDGTHAPGDDPGAGARMMKAYENICQQLIDDYKITKGTAVDIGCGPGQMAVKLAQMTDLTVTGLDIEPEAVEAGRQRAKEAGLGDRAQFICADAHSLPFADNSIDLVMSKGTIPFLRDQVLAVKEIYRVLRPGGVAFIGGGFGRYTSTEQENQIRGDRREAWYGVDPASPQASKSAFPFPVLSYDALMTRAGIGSYKVIREGGNWVEIRK